MSGTRPIAPPAAQTKSDRSDGYPVKNAICATHSFGPGDPFAVGFRIVKDLP